MTKKFQKVIFVNNVIVGLFERFIQLFISLITVNIIKPVFFAFTLKVLKCWNYKLGFTTFWWFTWIKRTYNLDIPDSLLHDFHHELMVLVQKYYNSSTTRKLKPKYDHIQEALNNFIAKNNIGINILDDIFGRAYHCGFSEDHQRMIDDRNLSAQSQELHWEYLSKTYDDHDSNKFPYVNCGYKRRKEISSAMLALGIFRYYLIISNQSLILTLLILDTTLTMVSLLFSYIASS